ncbi:MAG: CBS domain-containing protein, partial [Candidatus Bathyarchaeota archaeon]
MHFLCARIQSIISKLPNTLLYGGVILKIRDIMREPITIEISRSIQEVAKIMTDNRIGSVIVTDDKGIAGIVTQRDFVEKL